MDEVDVSDPTKIEFVLYVSRFSQASIKAMRNLERLLDEYDRREVHLVVRDLAEEPLAEDESDRITFTPTLVKRRPLPKTWVVGDLENTKFVADLLAYAGVAKKS